MPDPTAALIIVFTLFLGLWPLACLLAAIHHFRARHWRQLGQLGLLLPLWTIATSIGLMTVAPFIGAANAAKSSPDPFLATAGIGFALFCGVAAWSLLYRSFDRFSPAGPTASTRDQAVGGS